MKLEILLFGLSAACKDNAGHRSFKLPGSQDLLTSSSNSTDVPPTNDYDADYDESYEEFMDNHKELMNLEIDALIKKSLLSMLGNYKYLIASQPNFLATLEEESEILRVEIEETISKYVALDEARPKCFDYQPDVCSAHQTLSFGSILGDNCPYKLCPESCEVCTEPFN